MKIFGGNFVFFRCFSSFSSDTEEKLQEESPVLTKREVGTYADK